MQNIPEQTQGEIEASIQRDQKCEPVASAIIQLLAQAAPTFSEKTPEDLEKFYEPIAKEVVKLFLKHDVTLMESNYIMRIFRSAFDSLQNMVVKLTQGSFDAAEKKVWNVEKTDLSLRQVHEILTGKPYNEEEVNAL